MYLVPFVPFLPNNRSIQLLPRCRLTTEDGEVGFVFDDLVLTQPKLREGVARLQKEAVESYVQLVGVDEEAMALFAAQIGPSKGRPVYMDYTRNLDPEHNFLKHPKTFPGLDHKAMVTRIINRLCYTSNGQVIQKPGLKSCFILTFLVLPPLSGFGCPRQATSRGLP
jgi:hypothetical protein